MGTFLSKCTFPTLAFNSPWGSRKRKFIEDDDEEAESTPKRIKLTVNQLSVRDHIYNELFKGGTYSDVKIVALGHEWKLHKVYLKQCPYFASMFSGAWKETQEDVVNIEVIDPNITVDALDKIFGSLYTNEFGLSNCHLVPIMAAAALFQMHMIVEACASYMISNTLSHKTVLCYHAVGEKYGSPAVTEAAFYFLLNNISHNRQLWRILPRISVELMAELIESQDLLVISTEFTLYYVLCKWLYCQIRCCEEKKFRFRDIHVTTYFSKLPGSEPFLSTDEGSKFALPFSRLRLNHILSKKKAVYLVKKQRILPVTWINEAIRNCYIETLRAHEGMDHGPTQEQTDEVLTRGLRLGKIVQQSHVSFHWPGIMTGLTASISVHENLIEITRIRQLDMPSLTNTLQSRSIVIRLRVAPLVKKVVESKKIPSSIEFLQLGLGEKREIYRFPHHFQFPIVVGVDLLLTTSDGIAEERDSE